MKIITNIIYAAFALLAFAFAGGLALLSTGADK